MRIPLYLALAALACGLTLDARNDVSVQRSQPTALLQSDQAQAPYFWSSTAVGSSAQLLTLFCRACNVSQGAIRDVPLVSVLRDTLGDQGTENDTVSYVWLLSYAHPSLGQRMLSAIPFFYWRVGKGSGSVSRRDTAPLMDLSAPQHPMMVQVSQDLLQWAAFDTMMTPVRASTRAYRSNGIDDERLHLEEAISFLRQAPVGSGPDALTEAEVNTVIARLALRMKLLGGLANQAQAERLGMESNFEAERIRSRNWELLREWAEKTGLIFEPLRLAGTSSQYAMLWFPQKESPEPVGDSLRPIWKLLNIKNPWADERLQNWKGTAYERPLPNDTQGRDVRLIPLAVYSLNYPKLPLLLVDFRDKLRGRRYEMTQRTINELTAGVIGISHFTNWYYYVGADLYDFVAGRHGRAVDEASRLDCYSQFRSALALDRSIDPNLREEIEARVESLAVNPLEAAPNREIQDATARYNLLMKQAGDNGELARRVDQERRFELATFGESEKARLARSMLHVATLGAYKQQAKRENISILDCNRRVAYQLNFLNSLVQGGTPPEVSYDSQRIQASVRELSGLIPTVQSRRVRERAKLVLERLRSLSKDSELQADCSLALVAMRRYDAIRNRTGTDVVALPRGVGDAASPADTDPLK